MNKEYKIKLDLNKKLYNKKMAFNQFDENVNDFYIEITKNNEVVKDLDKSIITLVAIKPNNAVDAQFIEVKEGQIYADLKPSMCDLVGNYQAKAMIALEGEIVTTDTINYSVSEDKIISRFNDDVVSDERFTLFTDALARLSDIEASEEQRIVNEAERILSEENRKIEEAKRVEAELIRQHEEADRAKYDATRESNENIRKQNESIRLANETNRIDEEAKRVEEENKRKLAEEERKDNYNFMTEDEDRRRSEANAHKEAEVLRVQAETIRVNEEAKRRTTEQARVSAENTRVSNENTREANEVARQNNENQRIEAETQRKNRYNSFITEAEANANNFENYTNTAKVKEEERKSNELDRQSQEDRRVSNEVERISNENTRKANEKAREKNETSRQYIFENKVDEVDTKISELNTTKDNFVSSVNTKVDSKISELDNAKSDMTTTVSNKVKEVETRFNALTASQQQDAEVIDARDGETSLKARLDRDIEKAKQVYANVEGSNISTDSSVGYAKDVEILGNTIQSASNLADIRSVGDKVEGQELYEIPVVSCGKNLFNMDNISSNIISKSNDTYEIHTQTPIDLYNKGIFKAVKNVQYTVSYKVKLGTATNFRADFVYTDGSYQQCSLCNSTTEFIEITATSNRDKQLDYVRFNWTNAGTVYIKDIQLEEGTQATPYEPYIEDKLTILSPVQLEKVGDVADRLIEKDGVWGVEKNVLSYIVEDFSNFLADDKLSNVYRIYIDTNNDFGHMNRGMISSIVPYNGSVSWAKDEEGVYSDDTGKYGHRLWMHINKSKVISTPEEYVRGKLPIKVTYKNLKPQFIPLPHDQQVKLRTFANKTNISFLTEIEGTIKAQVPKSLGATVNTHTEQINNLNKELDRVKKLEESTVSTVTTESDFTTVEATSNGYFEDVKLEGKTLVDLKNGVGSFDYNCSTSYTDYSVVHKGTDYVEVVFNSKPNVWSYISTPYIKHTLLKSNTEYTIIFENIQGIKHIRLSNGSANEVFSETYSVSGNTVKIKTLPTFPAVASSIMVYCTPTHTERAVVGRYVILEGDHTQNPPSGYIEGLKSVGQDVDEIVVSSVNENLIPTPTYRLDIPSGASTNNYSNTIICKNIPIKPNTTYRVSYGEYINKGNIAGYPLRCMTFRDKYDGEDVHVNAYTHKNRIKENAEQVFTTEADAKYLVITTGSFISVGNIEITELCLTESSVEKPYTPHQSDKKRLLYYNNETQTWEKPILREWDSIEKHADGKYYYHQRSGEVVLNGSESWYLNAGWSGEEMSTNSYYLTADGQKAAGLMVKSSGATNIISEVMPTVLINNTSLDSDCISGEIYTGAIYIRINKSKVLNGIKPYLQQNPMRVVYQLAEEKVYECTNIDLITYVNETNYVVESGAIAPKSTLKVHSNISNVVSLLQKKVSLLESNITSYMITQNRLMLASRYNADTVSFKVDVATLRNSFEYDNDLYELILNNILVGKDNYNREYIENLIIFYWMDFIISDEMYSTLFEIIEEQHNPKIEETPLI